MWYLVIPPLTWLTTSVGGHACNSNLGGKAKTNRQVATHPQSTSMNVQSYNIIICFLQNISISIGLVTFATYARCTCFALGLVSFSVISACRCRSSYHLISSSSSSNKNSNTTLLTFAGDFLDQY